MTRPARRRLNALPVALALLVPGSGCGGGSTPSSPSASPTAVPTATLPSLDAMLADKAMGDPAARVALIEYASLTCPHCASFHEGTLAQIKAVYIDTGKVKLVYRDYPLDEKALSAAMVARCAGDKYFAVIDLLFAGQASWALSADTVGALKRVVAPAGVSSATVDACLARGDLRSGVLQIQADGQRLYGVRATPTFIVGDQMIVGDVPFAEFDAILAKATSG